MAAAMLDDVVVVMTSDGGWALVGCSHGSPILRAACLLSSTLQPATSSLRTLFCAGDYSATCSRQLINSINIVSMRVDGRAGESIIATAARDGLFPRKLDTRSIWEACAASPLSRPGGKTRAQV